MKKWWNKKNKKDKLNFLIDMLLIFIGIVILVVVLFAKQIFGEDSLIGQVLGDSQGGFQGILNAIENKIPIIIKSFVIIIVVAFITRIVRAIVKRILSIGKRGKTIATLIDSFIKYASFIAMLLVLLNTWGVDTKTLVASLGVIGLVVGLGCQSLISDIVSGIFIIFENQFSVSDIVIIDGFRGTVTEIGIRTTKITDAGGDIKVINNSNISSIVNLTSQLSVAICDVDIEYGESIERVESVIAQNLDQMKIKISTIAEGPFYKGIATLGASGVTIRLMAKCKEEDKYQTIRDLNREIKLVFDKNKINIPFPQVVLNHPVEFQHVTKKEVEEAKQFVQEQKELSKHIVEDEHR